MVNNHRSFGDLPKELGQAVLVEGIRLIHSTIDYEGPPSTPSTHINNLRLVCRLWNQLILASPRAWAYLDTLEPKQWIDLSILRSSNAPLIVSHDESFKRTELECYSHTIGRWRSLSYQFDTEPSSILFQKTAPHLEQLFIAAGNDADFRIETLFKNDMPSLTSVHLHQCYLSYPTTFVTSNSITDLTIKCVWEQDFDEMMKLLDMLRGLQHSLQTLSLNNVIGAPRAPSSSTEYLEIGAPVVLSRLRKLTMDECRSGLVARLLRSLVAPCLVELEVTGSDWPMEAVEAALMILATRELLRNTQLIPDGISLVINHSGPIAGELLFACELPKLSLDIFTDEWDESYALLSSYLKSKGNEAMAPTLKFKCQRPKLTKLSHPLIKSLLLVFPAIVIADSE